MSEEIYTYSKSTDFGGEIAPGQLHTEIENDGVIDDTTLLRVDVTGDVVEIVFDGVLPGDEQTQLETVIIPAHVPSPLNYMITSEGYVDISSELADGEAVKISATDPVGGIAIDAGNGISIDAGAASNFSTTGGDLTFDASGVINMQSGGGFNIGTDPDSAAINIGTGASARQIAIGNNNTTSYVNLIGGTGGINLDTTGAISLDASGASSNFTLATTGDAQDLTIALTGANNSSIVLDSAGTGADAIRMRTDGGFDLDSTGAFNLSTGANVGGAITLDASFNNGGMNLSAGNLGIAINAGGGTIGIGHWAASTILLGTAGSNSTTIGNTTGTSGVTINSGTGGINIGGNSSPGEVHIANTAVAKSMYIGNDTSGSRIFVRHSTSGFFRSQPAHTALTDSNNAISLGALLSGILTGTPTADRTQTLPDASTIVSGISGIAVGDSFDFYFINKSTTDDAEWIIAMGSGGTMEGNASVAPKFHSVVTYKTSGTGYFRLRMDNVTASSEAYTVYRLG